MKKIKILIVDDSAFMRLLISDLLSQASDIEVVGSAANGQEAVTKTKELSPDVVLMDMTMGEYDGLYGVEHIMHEKPTPILILSSLGNTNLNPIFDALRLGAVDYINKPKRGGSKIREMDAELIQRVRKVAQAKPRTMQINEEPVYQKTVSKSTSKRFDLIVIGASTGGPSAIEKIVSNLPANLNVPVVIVQHMPDNFITSFANRLNALSALEVKVAKIGARPEAGSIFIAPGNANIVLRQTEYSTLVFDTTDVVFKEYNKPSINAFMLSAQKIMKDKLLAILLTGMGKDGVKGMAAIKKTGGVTVAQDEISSIIFGMPKHAIEAGSIDHVLGIKEVAGFIVNSLKL